MRSVNIVFGLIMLVAGEMSFATQLYQNSALTQKPQYSYSHIIKRTAKPSQESIKLNINQGITEFFVSFESITQKQCSAEVTNIYSGGKPIPSLGSHYTVNGNPNIKAILIKYYVRENQGECKLVVKGFRPIVPKEVLCNTMKNCSYEYQQYLKKFRKTQITAYGIWINQKVTAFDVELHSVNPWICEAEIFNVYADGQALPRQGHRYFLSKEQEIKKLEFRIYSPKNSSDCILHVKGIKN